MFFRCFKWKVAPHHHRLSDQSQHALPWGEAASPFCLGLKGEGGSAAVSGLFSLVSSTPLSFSDRPSAGGVSPFTGAWRERERATSGKWFINFRWKDAWWPDRSVTDGRRTADMKDGRRVKARPTGFCSFLYLLFSVFAFLFIYNVSSVRSFFVYVFIFCFNDDSGARRGGKWAVRERLNEFGEKVVCVFSFYCLSLFMLQLENSCFRNIWSAETSLCVRSVFHDSCVDKKRYPVTSLVVWRFLFWKCEQISAFLIKRRLVSMIKT